MKSLCCDSIYILDISLSDDGHRRGYMAFLEKLYPAKRTSFRWSIITEKCPVLVPQIEESFGKYVAICILRCLLGHRTVGFLFRPRPTLEGRSLRLRLKRLAIHFLLSLHNVRTLTIIPFSVEPKFASIADDWIYDFESWDLLYKDDIANNTVAKLGNDIVQFAAGRKVCCSIGRQDTSKGFDQFTHLYMSSQSLRDKMLFAFGGKVAPDMLENAGKFKAVGGFSRQRFIADEELLDFYNCANLVWCVYSPEYDQASGILGRAMQLGVPVVVRKGSLIHRQCEIEGVKHIAIDLTTNVDKFLQFSEEREPDLGIKRALSHRDESLRRLSNALGVASKSECSKFTN